jgi:hypothetical protein
VEPELLGTSHTSSRRPAEGWSSPFRSPSRRAARILSRRFLRMIRLRAQSGGAPPEPVGHAELVDVAEWTRIPVTVKIEPLVLRQVSEEQVLNEDRLAPLLAVTSKGARPSLAHSVLVDAAFYASDAEPPDPTRAVLTAGIAVELKVKQTLLEAAEGQLRELVALLIESPRDYSLAAIALFDKPLRIVLGVSLRNSDKELYRRIDTLFRRRNDVAHRGKPIGEGEATELVATAYSAFRALRSVAAEAAD